MHTTGKKFHGRSGMLACLMVGLVCGSALAQVPSDPLLDFRFFEVPSNRQRTTNPLAVQWLVRSDAESYCQQIVRKDGHASHSEGCVFWHQAEGQCTVVTTAYTTHSLLGHLYLHCLRGR